MKVYHRSKHLYLNMDTTQVRQVVPLGHVQKNYIYIGIMPIFPGTWLIFFPIALLNHGVIYLLVL